MYRICRTLCLALLAYSRDRSLRPEPVPSFSYARAYVAAGAFASNQSAYAQNSIIALTGPDIHSGAKVPIPSEMGQASRFRLGGPVFRFHDSDSETSSPSVVSVVSAGFAQVWGQDIRFFPSDDDSSPAASSESLSSSLSRPGLRYRHPQPWLPIDIRPRYMYSAGLLAIVASDARQARMPMIFQSLEGNPLRIAGQRLDATLP